MSIRLCVDSYCHDCPHFELDVERNNYTIDNKCMCETLIRCEHRFKCDKITAYLRKELNKEKVEKDNGRVRTNDNRCIFCGTVIPEGRITCPNCDTDEEDFKR